MTQLAVLAVASTALNLAFIRSDWRLAILSGFIFAVGIAMQAKP